jgi:ferritin-like metal-binding protein YciE
MKVQNLEDAFFRALADIYSAEKQLVRALPALAKAAAKPELKQAFEKHLVETQGHVERINKIITETGSDLECIPCKAMEGLVKEGEETIKVTVEGPVRDALLISDSQKVEHYEIAAYRTLVEFAKQLGYAKSASLLRETLEEEKSTDEALSEIAVSSVSTAACAMDVAKLEQV